MPVNTGGHEQFGDFQALKRVAAEVRARVIEFSHRAETPHLGSSLSCIDILVAMYGEVLRIDPKKPEDPNRDRFILSKGHAALALYITLAKFGFFSGKRFGNLCKVRQHACGAAKSFLQAGR